MTNLHRLCGVVCIIWAGFGFGPAFSSALQLNQIDLPPGFQIAIYAAKLPNARSMALGANRTLFVGTRKTGKVYGVVDTNGDQRADRIYLLARGLNMPNGVTYCNGALYVAEVHRIIRFDAIESRLDRPPPPEVVYDQLPTKRHHGWKYIAFGPDGHLYVPVGAPCNVCEETDPRFAGLLRMAPDGSQVEIFARGIRNTVGFDWHPATGALWFTNNGRDWMGDDLPPDTLHQAPQPGLHFGFPYCHAGRIPDPVFGKTRTCSEFAFPALELDPHVAPLGMKFYTGSMFPPAYQGDIIIAEHGSWNRSTPIGYRLTRIRMEGNRAVGWEVFAQGWLQSGKAWGRPVDVLVMPDGALLVSDDRAGVIYRIAYQAP